MKQLKISWPQAKYIATDLVRRRASSDLDSFTQTLQDARVDLNPHQVESALFAFRSPLSGGAILADEVGLGKTIEAGIILSQKWAERKRRLVVITPANLRKQWVEELEEKFYLPAFILDRKVMTRFLNNEKGVNPFETACGLSSHNFKRADTIASSDTSLHLSWFYQSLSRMLWFRQWHRAKLCPNTGKR